MTIDRTLPAQILLDRQTITFAGILEAEQASAHGRDHLRLAADHPAMVSGRGQIGDRERAAIWPDHIVHAWTQLTVHRIQLNFPRYAGTALTWDHGKRARLKIS